jgi:hypothetical protein
MPYFRTDNINILFIHIPKTGGTSIENYFSQKYNIPLNSDTLLRLNSLNEFIIENIIFDSSPQHFTYEILYKYRNEFNIEFKDIRIITVVRNPYARIISDLFYFEKITIDTSKEEVFHKIENYLQSKYLDNHNIPQYLFVTDDKKQLVPYIHIFHNETLNCEMRKLGYDDFCKFDNFNPCKKKYDHYYYLNYLNTESIRLINEFYDYDFKLFNYTKIDPFNFLSY